LSHRTLRPRATDFSSKDSDGQISRIAKPNHTPPWPINLQQAQYLYGDTYGLRLAITMAKLSRMRSVPLGEAKDKLSALVDDAQSTHDIIAITKHGRPAAVLMSVDDLESLQETVFWLSQPGIRDDIAA
jgi:antitoxin YefM